MSAKPYTPEEMHAIRDLAMKVPVTDGSLERWLATLDAARAEALEEAARVAETHYLQPCPTLCGQSIAAAIRALAQKARGV